MYKQTMDKWVTMPDQEIEIMAQDISKIKPSKLKSWSMRTRFENGQLIKIRYRPLNCMGMKSFFVVNGASLNRANVFKDDVACDIPILSLSQTIAIEDMIELETTFAVPENDLQMYSGMNDLYFHNHTGNHRSRNHFISVPKKL